MNAEEVPATAPEITIRHAVVGDAAATQAIYNHEVENSTTTFDLVARSIAEQRAWLLDRAGARSAIVAELEGHVVGFASLSAYRERPAYSTSVENSVYVAESVRRRGVGLALLEGIVDVATNHGFHTIIARVAASQEASVALHRRVGFEVVGVEREVGRKFGRWLDVTVLQRMLAPTRRVTRPDSSEPGLTRVGREGFEPS